MARPPDFDLAGQLAKPSFTPGQHDATGLVALVVGGDEPAATRAQNAVAELGAVGRGAIERAIAAADAVSTTDEGAKARLVTALGLCARRGDAVARAAVIARTTDASSRVRRAAETSLGKLGGDDARAALLVRWDATDAPPDERRTLAEALGKVGGDDAIARLRDLGESGDPELGRRRDRALLMAERSAQRDEVSEIATDVAPPSPLVVRLRCKPGLALLMLEELTASGFRPGSRSDAEVDVVLDKPWSALFASRLWATAAIRIELAQDVELGVAITRALVAPAVRALLNAWTRGPIRWRLGFAHGHKRSIVWRVARDVAAAAPELVNDPAQTTWDVLVADDSGESKTDRTGERTRAWLEIVPRRAVDPRFAWRVAEIPAASHPAVAAAIARLGEARPSDRVWDPFAGSAAELIERARLGPARSLLGTDLEDAALAAARANLDAAQVTATLVKADARSHAGGPFDLILTNPPLGSRIHLDAGALLGAALPNLVRQLAPSGRLVWITPAHRKTTPVLDKLGLRRVRTIAVDLGGVRGHLERWDREP